MKIITLSAIVLCSSIFNVGCTDMVNKVESVINKNAELYEITDKFVESLDTKYESYGMLGGKEHETKTKDGLYKVMPIGRLINVRIEEYVDAEEYEKLKASLKSHYKDDPRVNDVYICQAGTIMIDCRN